MHGEASIINLPPIEEFRKNGKFYKIPIKKKSLRLPEELYRFIFPDFAEHMFQTKKGPNKSTINKLINYCISLKKEVLKEERLFHKKLIQDNEIREITQQLEKKINDYWSNFYATKYKNCKCKNTNI